MPLNSSHPLFQTLIDKQRKILEGIQEEFDKFQQVRDVNPNLPSPKNVDASTEDLKSKELPPSDEDQEASGKSKSDVKEQQMSKSS